jgi:hypothetical protein
MEGRPFAALGGSLKSLAQREITRPRFSCLVLLKKQYVASCRLCVTDRSARLPVDTGELPEPPPRVAFTTIFVLLVVACHFLLLNLLLSSEGGHSPSIQGQRRPFVIVDHRVFGYAALSLARYSSVGMLF